MKTNKILININNLNEIEYYKKIGITNFLFAIKDFSLGYTTYALEDLININANIYLLINRMFDSKSLDEFKKIIPKLNFIKGLFFEDIGIYEILKDTNIPLIWNQVQFGTNYLTLNYWLDKVESAVISNSLTKEEIIEIIKKANKPLIFNIFGKNMAMYSRRTLLTNFNNHFNLKNNNEAILKETLQGNEFLVRESNYGTVLFNNTYFDYTSILSDIPDNKILFYYINNIDLDKETIKQFLQGSYNLGDYGFLNKKTIFKVGGDKNDRTS